MYVCIYIYITYIYLYVCMCVLIWFLYGVRMYSCILIYIYIGLIREGRAHRKGDASRRAEGRGGESIHLDR